ncbi:MAG: hypothetical protein EON52_05205, partial [Actinomycetales bacterium]
MRDGQPRYALIMSYPPSLLQQMIDASIDVPQIRAAVIDRRNVVVAANSTSSFRLADTVAPIPIPVGATKGFYETT